MWASLEEEDSFHDFVSWKKDVEVKPKVTVEAVKEEEMIVVMKSSPAAPKDIVEMEEVIKQDTLEEPFEARGGLTFRDIRVVIKKKELVRDVAGYVQPGEMLYVMGPSGAGKTTILDALADRFRSGMVSGVVRLFGEEKSERLMEQLSRYVPQFPSAFGCLTVREMFSFSAKLHHGTKVENAVLEMADALGLESCIDVAFGDAWRRGLSSGQQRRAAIGVALLQRPRVLLLDEPTSGLDVAAAEQLMQQLMQACLKSQVACIAVIHQPTQRIFDAAHNVLLMSSGRPAYFGPPAALQPYLTKTLTAASALASASTSSSSSSHQLVGSRESLPMYVVPPRMGVAEWALNLLTREYWDDGGECVDWLLDAWPTSPLRHRLRQRIETIESLKPSSSSQHVDRSPLLVQFSTIIQRLIVLYARDPSFGIFRVALYVLLSFFAATLWVAMPVASSAAVSSINGLLYFVVSFLSFLALSACPAFIYEFQLVMWERKGNSFNYATYLGAHSIVEVVYLFFLAILCASICYFAAPLNMSSANHFFILVANLFVSFCVCDSLVLAISLLTQHFVVAAALSCGIFGVFFCLQSYFIPVPQIGWWWQWIKFIDPLFFAYGVAVVNQYLNTTFAPSCTSPNSCYLNGLDGEQIISSFGFDSRIWVGIIVQLSMAVILRFAALLCLHFFMKGKK